MSRVLLSLVAMVALAACGVPEVDLELPERPRATIGQVDPGTGAAGDPGQPDPSVDPAPGSGEATPGAPDPDELDELEQLVSEIESLLEGVSDELDQITFEEEGG